MAPALFGAGRILSDVSDSEKTHPAAVRGTHRDKASIPGSILTHGVQPRVALQRGEKTCH